MKPSVGGDVPPTVKPGSGGGEGRDADGPADLCTGYIDAITKYRGEVFVFIGQVILHVLGIHPFILLSITQIYYQECYDIMKLQLALIYP